MNVLGTFNGAGRRHFADSSLFLMGLGIGAAALGLVLFTTRAGLPDLPMRQSLLTWLCVSTSIFVLDVARRFRFAANLRVPASWVTHRRRGPVVWGLFLGSALITEAPFVALHVALLGAVILPHPSLVLAVPTAFALGRFAITTSAQTRRLVLAGMERRLGECTGTPISIASALIFSRVAVATALALSARTYLT